MEITLQKAFQIQQGLNRLTVDEDEEEERELPARLNFKIVSNINKLEDPIKSARETLQNYEDEEQIREEQEELMQEEIEVDLHELDIDEIPNTKPSVIAAIMPILNQ